jgi:hypothetical protein
MFAVNQLRMLAIVMIGSLSTLTTLTVGHVKLIIMVDAVATIIALILSTIANHVASIEVTVKVNLKLKLFRDFFQNSKFTQKYFRHKKVISESFRE